MRIDYYHDSHAPQPNSLVPAASAVITDLKGRILLHKRSDNHLWSLPGGAMEIGESIRDTIIREVKEETGFDIVIMKCTGLYTDPNHVIAYSDGEIRQQFSICFAGKIVGGTKCISSESTQVEFFTKDQIDQMELHPAQRQRIDDYFSYEDRAFIR